MTIEELKKYEGKKVIVKRTDKAITIGVLSSVKDDKVVFEKNNIEIFPVKGNPRMTHSCELHLYASFITEIREADEND